MARRQAYKFLITESMSPEEFFDALKTFITDVVFKKESWNLRFLTLLCAITAGVFAFISIRQRKENLKLQKERRKTQQESQKTQEENLELQKRLHSEDLYVQSLKKRMQNVESYLKGVLEIALGSEYYDRDGGKEFFSEQLALMDSGHLLFFTGHAGIGKTTYLRHHVAMV